MTGLTPLSSLFLANLNRTEERLAEANSQVSSGKKINVASDDPDQIDILLQLRADLQRNSQIQSNLDLANTDASAADNALSSAATLMDRAVQLATEAANTTTSADTRASIASEVASIQAEMVSCSQTQVDGRYIFSGDQDGSPTYQLDLNSATTGVDQLAAPPATRQVEDPAGGSFAVSQTAQFVFDDTNADGTPANDNVFAALNTLRTALLSNDQSGITNSLNLLKSASTHLDNMQAFYGTVEDRIQAATTFASQYGTQLQTQISNVEDADIPSAALELTQANTQLQAAFQMEGQMPTKTLFDFLA
jgi:flagellar hook-associated protein 3 FlgL